MHKILQNVQFFKLQEQIDHDLAAQAQQAGCPLCGGRLDCANYPRKSRGGPIDWNWRLSFCCDRCRKRMTPVSVRFLGPKVYVGAMVTLAAAMQNGLAPWRVARLSRELGVGRRTLRRWREWWRKTFVNTPFWKGARGAFARPVAEGTMPLGLVETFGADGAAGSEEGMMRLLLFIAPITTGRRCGGLGM